MYEAEPYIPQTGYQAIVDAELNEDKKEKELVKDTGYGLLINIHKKYYLPFLRAGSRHACV